MAERTPAKARRYRGVGDVGVKRLVAMVLVPKTRSALDTVPVIENRAKKNAYFKIPKSMRACG